MCVRVAVKLSGIEAESSSQPLLSTGEAVDHSSDKD